VTLLDYAYWITQFLLALGVLFAVYRVYKGPSVLDRVISVDVILIIVGSVMLVEMAYSGSTDYILFVVVTAVIGFLGAVAIARYVAVREPDSGDRARRAEAEARAITGEPASEPETPKSPWGTGAQPHGGTLIEDESTSWFAALARSGFVPSRNKDRSAEAESEKAAEGPDQGSDNRTEPGGDK
jgi:multisubunit Na+/H+ antiporter MnhF subunit